MSRYIIVVLLLFIHYSCVKDNNSSEGIKQIHFSLNKKDNIKVDYLIDSIKYVKLETDSDYLINNVKKIIYHNQNYYILNGKSDAIYVFNREGKLVSKLFQQGEGPDEYILINDFSIDKKNSTIVVLDIAQKKFLTYNKNCKLIDKNEMPYFIRLFITTSSTGYLTYDETEGITSLDRKEGNKNVILPFLGKHLDIPMNDMGYLYWIDHKNGIFSVADNAVYTWDGDKLNKKYQLIYDKSTPADVYRGKADNFDLCIAMHHETSRWILQVAASMKEKNLYYLLYDKEKDKAFTIKEIENLKDGIFPPAAPSLAEDRLIYAQFLPADELKEQLAAHPDNPLSDDLKEIIYASTNDDNPILQVIYLKK